MHEISESVSSPADSQGVIADGRLDSRRVDRDSHRGTAAAFVGMEIDGDQPAFRFESTGGGGLDSQSQLQRTSKHLRRARSGRRARLDRSAQSKLEKPLKKSPEDFGLQRSRRDKTVMVEFLRKERNVELQPRQSRNRLKRLGFVLKRLTYRYLHSNNK
jgi:transposase